MRSEKLETRRKSARGWWLALPVAALTAALPVQAEPDSLTQTAIKRYFLARIDERCHRLDPAAAMAVKAGYLQARNASIRVTGSLDALNPYLAQADDAAGRVDCQSPELTAEVNAADSAYRSYAALPRLELSSGRTNWLVNRASGNTPDWRLVQYQSNASGDMALGLYGTLAAPDFAVMADFKDGATPYSARLLVRDPGVLAAGMINHAGYDVTTEAPVGFDGGSVQTFLARASSEQKATLKPTVKTNLAGFSLTGNFVGQQGPADAIRFDFPTRAYAAIARLDPREDVVVAFDFPDGTRYVRFEVGDFVTGLSYVMLPSPYGQTAG